MTLLYTLLVRYYVDILNVYTYICLDRSHVYVFSVYTKCQFLVGTQHWFVLSTAVLREFSLNTYFPPGKNDLHFLIGLFSKRNAMTQRQTERRALDHLWKPSHQLWPDKLDRGYQPNLRLKAAKSWWDVGPSECPCLRHGFLYSFFFSLLSSLPGLVFAALIQLQRYHSNIYLKQVRKSICQIEQLLRLQNLTHPKFETSWYLRPVGSSWHPITPNPTIFQHHPRPPPWWPVPGCQKFPHRIPINGTVYIPYI